MIFPILPMLVCFVIMAFSIAYELYLGVALSGVALLALLVADRYMLRQRAKHPDFNPWDEI